MLFFCYRYLPLVGMVTILMNDYPMLKVSYKHMCTVYTCNTYISMHFKNSSAMEKVCCELRNQGDQPVLHSVVYVYNLVTALASFSRICNCVPCSQPVQRRDPSSNAHSCLLVDVYPCAFKLPIPHSVHAHWVTM